MYKSLQQLSISLASLNWSFPGLMAFAHISNPKLISCYRSELSVISFSTLKRVFLSWLTLLPGVGEYAEPPRVFTQDTLTRGGGGRESKGL